MTNGGVGPRSSVRLSTSATPAAATMPTRYMANSVRPCNCSSPPATARRGNERADQKRVDRQPRAAAHQRRDQNRRQPIAAVLDHARGHDAGNRAGERRQQRNERLAAQAHADHQLVHQVRGAGHVAAIFQHRQEEKQDQNLRQKDQHAADAADHAVDQQRLQRPVGIERASTASPRQPIAASIGLHQRIGGHEDRRKNDQHGHREDQRAPQLVRQQAIDPIAGA